MRSLAWCYDHAAGEFSVLMSEVLNLVDLTSPSAQQCVPCDKTPTSRSCAVLGEIWHPGCGLTGLIACFPGYDTHTYRL